ncbi:MAG TPA: hypothetical protein VES79_14245 [Solirubrobacteraceae bacterium]|nr:hypothetical protein [Solirubrobacteraceae bacterium]
MTDERAQRIAENESRFRSINDRMRADLETVAEEGEPLDFVCECGNDACRESVPLSVGEYEAVRVDARRFAIVPGHEIPDVETVVETHDGRYAVIEKDPRADPIVKATDPRADEMR